MGDSMQPAKSVLIVEDESPVMQLLHATLSMEGYRCTEAENGDSAMELLKTTPFDIMITDIVMPGMGGLELAERAKKLHPAMLIIIMTGFLDEFSYEKAVTSGASDFIKKPFTSVELLIRIKHVLQQERLRVLSITDELTGLLNRRGFFSLAEQQLKMARRKDQGGHIMYVDIDDMKDINDTLGHQEGDLALIDTAHLLRTTFRNSDIIARIGGDEFVVIPLESDDPNLENITARLQKNVDRHNKSRQRKYTLSLSFGISRYDPGSSESLDKLLTLADKLMLEQKKLKHRG
jgi:diguanylate cyclase (GGDEF)-like protein